MKKKNDTINKQPNVNDYFYTLFFQDQSWTFKVKTSQLKKINISFKKKKKKIVNSRSSIDSSMSHRRLPNTSNDLT